MVTGGSAGRIPRTSGERLYLFAVVHLAVLAASYALAFALRFDLGIPASAQSLLVQTLPWVLLVKMLIFYRLGNFQGWWCYVTLADLSALLRASTLSGLVLVAIDYLLVTSYQIPRSTLLLDWGLTVLLRSGLRSASRDGSSGSGWKAR